MKGAPNVKRLKAALYAAIAVIAFLIAALIAVLAGSSSQSAVPQQSEQTPVPAPAITAEPEEASYMLIETPHINLRLPKENVENIVHEHETRGMVNTEVFYMVSGEEQVPLYRFDFGDAEAGDWLGVLKTEDGDVPVTYTVFVVADEELAALGENMDQIYVSLMNGFNIILDGIMSDSRFTPEKPIVVGEEQLSALTYWSVELPANMSWTESTENGSYEAVFYGEVHGGRVALYTVRIGGEAAQTVLGQYKLDGVNQTVSVESFELSENPNWSEDDYSAAYRMMDTINDVIQVITASEAFSIPEPVEENH